MTKYAARSIVLSLDGDTIGQVVSGLEGAGSSRDLIDASAYGDDWKDYVVGQQDGSVLSLVIAYDPADQGHLAFLSMYDGGDPGDFEMEQTSSGFHVGFPGIITECTRGGPRDGLLTLNASVKILNPGVEDIES